MGPDGHFALSGEEGHDCISLSQAAERQFTDDERVTQKQIVSDDFLKFCVTISKMVDPD